ncbi:MAG: hypothetical protein NW223_12610 [Hyphomicrobiaceae bacterium]|nr:hypothetical protein [Hyphomicrobiaceae bacterium]
MIVSIEKIAEFSVARACGFAALAIFTLMIGFAWHPAVSFQTGGILTLLTCAILLLKGVNARRKPYKTTELWIILPKDQRPIPEIAQQLIGNVLRDVYLRFALHAAGLSALMLVSALSLSLLGVTPKY